MIDVVFDGIMDISGPFRVWMLSNARRMNGLGCYGVNHRQLYSKISL